MTPQELGIKLKQVRENLGISQADVAGTLNLTRTAITQDGKWESFGVDTRTEPASRTLSAPGERIFWRA